MKNGKSKSKYQGLSLREAALVSRYGPIAKSKLAEAALMLWPCERRLQQAEEAFSEILQDLQRLGELEAFAKKQLYRCNAGLDPTWLRDRARVMDKINALKPELLVAAHPAWKGRTVAQSMHDHAVARYNKTCVLAGRKARHGLAELRRRYDSGKVDDPMSLRLIELTRATVLQDRLTPDIEDHGPFFITLRLWVPGRYRLPWMVDIMPLSSSEFQGRLTMKGILPMPNKKIAEEYRCKLRDIGWKLAVKFKRDRRKSRLCECGEPLEKHQQECEVCRFHRPRYRRRGLPIDIAWPRGRSDEPSWRAEDRKANFWAGNYIEDQDESTAENIGIINQATRDVDAIKGAHADAVDAFGANEWRQIKFDIDHARMTGPMHQDLWNTGKGQDQDDDDYENRQG